MLVDDTSGNVADITVPGGPFNRSTGVGWKTNKPPVTTWTYVNRSSTLPGGIFHVSIKDKSKKTPGLVLFSAKGKSGSYPVTPGSLPASAIVVFDVPSAQTGQCANESWPGPKPAPSCAFNPKGSTLICK